MTFGQNAPLDPTIQYTDDIKAIKARLAELERAAGTPSTPTGFVTTDTTDGTGIITVSHGLGYTPTGIVATPRSTNHTQCRVDNITSTQFRYRAWDATGSTVNSTSIAFQWLPFR